MSLRDKSSESELKKDRNGRCSATVSPDRTDYSADHGTNRPGDHNASPNTVHLTIFHDERQQGGRDHDPGQDLHKANRMAAIAHDGQKNHSGQDTTGLD